MNLRVQTFDINFLHQWSFDIMKTSWSDSKENMVWRPSIVSRKTMITISTRNICLQDFREILKLFLFTKFSANARTHMHILLLSWRICFSWEASCSKIKWRVTKNILYIVRFNSITRTYITNRIRSNSVITLCKESLSFRD